MKTMSELRCTDTNAADDSAGRAFGLEGNLYLVLIVALMGSLAVAGLLGFVAHAPWPLTALLAGLPLAGVLGWILLFKHNKPAGYDRDQFDAWLGRGDFTRSPAEQEGLQ